MSVVAPLPSDVASPVAPSPEGGPARAKRKLSTPLISAISICALAASVALYVFFLEPYDEGSVRAAQERALANQQKLGPSEVQGRVGESTVEAKISADPAGPLASSAR